MITSSPQSPPKNTNSAILFAVSAAAAVAVYYYVRNRPLEDLSKGDQEVVAQKARESIATGKARADDVRKQVEQKYEEIRASTKQAIQVPIAHSHLGSSG